MVRAGRPRSRVGLARSLLRANGLPTRAGPSHGAPNGPLRGSVPSCHLWCGRDARVPGWVSLSALGFSSNPLVALRRPSWISLCGCLIGIDLQLDLKQIGGNPHGRYGIGLPDSKEKEHLVVLPLPPVIRPGGRGTGFLPETNSPCRPIDRAGCMPGRIGGARP